jgi:KaiC/GvpD/RAD55 family RecA-like ATPase
MKTFIFMTILCTGALVSDAQSIVGRWQLIKQSNCVENELEGEEDPGVKEMVEDMKGLSGSEPQIIEFKDNNTGSESTKIINRKKSYNSKSFLYRFDEQTLYILDKKSRTIVEGFTVEKMDVDSLIISNATRVCETKVFVRLK